MSLKSVADKLKKLTEEGSIEEADIEDLDSYLWNTGDLQEDTLVPFDGPGYRGPHDLNQIVRYPIRITLQNTKPPRGGVKR
jgi:hypothetical protein